MSYSSTMGFFWSGRNASVAGIFKRSARYWFTSLVGNCLWGPPGWRGPRNPRHPDHAKWLQQQAAEAVAHEYEGMTPVQIAESIGEDYGDLGRRMGWGLAHSVFLASIEVERVLGMRSGCLEEARVRNSGRLDYEAGPRYAGVKASGGVRGSTATGGWYQPGGRKSGAAVHHSGGLRGGAAKRWAGCGAG